ncbi:precorrin-3B C(17)-methyltransferase [uncultured Lamprocystis sp.]|jgi:precorrin-3B C17-methyltransferase|uniref:precorrin-3B C(17)-methyltransferase n=1 Tax=uncultured Lamprocystis sp. TaxID=543132 RepID=UPI0025F396B0|nr:precorrin-3B C(17)-methyltransferase [uncultured Lamprocystis sp.]
MTDSPVRGKLFLVGIGPGGLDHMTGRARAAIAQADTLIGHATYLRLVAELVTDQEVVKSTMTQELDRAVLAVELAQAGRTVALISSGDSGVYGMAGLTFEVLFQAGWTPDTGVPVEIVPGATALTSCAALAGAPLSHDFCAISLSDLLTPWPVIARRLNAAAAADFVVAIYNPKSGRRARQVIEAQRLFLCHRRPTTPVALVHAAYRSQQRVELTTLADLGAGEIGMLTTILIGNSQTQVHHGLMVTPRGYTQKYDLQAGTTKAGERGGHPLTSGLDGWLAELRASAETVTDLAERHGLPEIYIAAVLAASDPAAWSP